MYVPVLQCIRDFVRVRFEDYMGKRKVMLPTQLSPEKPDIPGGFEEHQRVWFVGSGTPSSEGYEVEYGKEGEVVGISRHDAGRVAVRFLDLQPRLGIH